MSSMAIKRVYEPPVKSDGKRILVDRIWPRGLTKDAAALTLWAKDLAPTTELRKWFDHQPERFAEFRRRYRAELSKNPAMDELMSSLGRGKATLLYSAKDPAMNQAAVFAEFMTESRGRK